MHPTELLSSPRAARAAARSGGLTGNTAGVAYGHVQGNVAILPREYAGEFERFCQRNPKPCPVLAIGDPGDPRLPTLGADVDIRTDCPRYRVFENGRCVDEPHDIGRWWRDDLVAFLLGCSFSFEDAMQRAGLPVRHIDERRNVPMYRTNIQTKPAGIFRGPTVVSMRPFTVAQTIRAVEITSRFSKAHGSPIHVGNPAAIGIADIHKPDFGDSVTIHPGEVPVFWACGVTPQAVLMEVKPELAITHSPGCMFVSDVKAEEMD